MLQMSKQSINLPMASTLQGILFCPIKNDAAIAFEPTLQLTCSPINCHYTI